jgi:hypothetical protein
MRNAFHLGTDYHFLVLLLQDQGLYRFCTPEALGHKLSSVEFVMSAAQNKKLLPFGADNRYPKGINERDKNLKVSLINSLTSIVSSVPYGQESAIFYMSVFWCHLPLPQ